MGGQVVRADDTDRISNMLRVYEAASAVLDVYVRHSERMPLDMREEFVAGFRELGAAMSQLSGQETSDIMERMRRRIGF